VKRTQQEPEQTPRKKGEVELYTRTEMQQNLKGKKNNKKTLHINNIKSSTFFSFHLSLGPKFRTIIFMPLMKKGLTMLLRTVFFFFFWVWLWTLVVGFLLFLFIVPNVFPSSSQGVLSNVFLYNVPPISPHFYVICFAQKLPSFHYIPGPKGRDSRFLF
jgi:hypothetical protein